MEQTLNANFAECIKTAANIGETKIYNICNGAVSTVPWGTMDYIEHGLLLFFAAAMVGVFGMFMLMLWRV